MKWLPKTKSLLKITLDLLLPKSCVLCKSPLSLGSDLNICPNCWENTVFIQTIRCRKCGLPSPLVGEEVADFASISQCGWCLKWNYDFDEARAIGLYQGNLKEVIHKYKYNHMVHLSKDLLSMFMSHFPADFREYPFDYLIPVPLHLQKLKEREYNQTVILAEKISSFLGVSLRTDILVRNKYTPPQVELSGAERWKNVKDAFEIRGKGCLKDKSILLLDDVFTTGATVHECSKVLRQGDPRRISVLTIARAIQ